MKRARESGTSTDPGAVHRTRRTRRGGRAVDGHRAVERLQETGEGEEKRGLSRAVGPEEGHHLAAIQVRDRSRERRPSVRSRRVSPSHWRRTEALTAQPPTGHVARQPRYASVTRPIGLDLGSRPEAISLAEVEYVDLVAQVHHELHVVVDEHDRDARVPAPPGRRSASHALSVVSRPAAGSSSRSSFGLLAERSSDRHQLPLPLRRARRRGAPQDSAEAQRPEDLVELGACRPPVVYWPTITFSSTVRSS